MKLSENSAPQNCLANSWLPFSSLMLMALPLGAASQEKVGMAPSKAPGTAIDINRASTDDFEKLPGVDPKLARQIVAYRSKHGSFHRVEDLLVIRGIGAKKWRALRPYLCVEEKA